MKRQIPNKPFYFIRHGESTWNVLNKFAGGQTDCPLTARGIEQAINAQSIFEQLPVKPDYIAHSSMVRAKKTAQIINKDTNLPMIAHYDLRELDGGNWTGGNFNELNRRWENSEKPDNGESLDMFSTRIINVFSEILDDSRLPLIVAHGRILNAIEHGMNIKGRVLQAGNCEFLYFKPHDDASRQYLWDVYRQKLKNGQIISELAAWSQI